MKKFSEAVLAPHKHMAKKASPHHPHSQALVYTPGGKEAIRPIDTADAGYGGETVSDAEGGEANPGKASKKAVSPMKMPTLVKPGLDKAKMKEETERERLMKLRSFATRGRKEGLGKAMMEDEQIDELKKSTLASYAKKATDDVSYHSFTAGGLPAKDPERLAQDKKAMKRQSGVIKAIDRLAKEEVEHVDETTNVTDYNPPSHGGTRAELLAKLAKSKSSKHAEAARKAGATQNELKKAMVSEDNDGTEADKGEYGYEGDMAMSQLKSIIRNAKELHDRMEPQTDLPEWLQSKITLASDYIQTASDYWKSEKNEVSEEVWDKPMPDSAKKGSLSPEQKAKAKARASRAGRSYPNMIDNMWASKQ